MMLEHRIVDALLVCLILPHLLCDDISIHAFLLMSNFNLNLMKKIQLQDDFVDLFYPFRCHQWYIKSASGKYYIYSTETSTHDVSSFEFPFGLQEFGINSMVIGSGPNELTLCDI
mgnify:CR=1 FL=1